MKSPRINYIVNKFPKFSLTYIFVFGYLTTGFFEAMYGLAFASEFKNNIANLTLMIVSYHFGQSMAQKTEEQKKEG